MRKIPTLFKRTTNTYLVYNEVTPGCEWMLAGEGTPTRKFDGTACLIKDGLLYKRYTHDPKRRRIPPAGFFPAQNPDPITGRTPGWVPISEGPEDHWHRAAYRYGDCLRDGTHELCGPCIQGNPEHLRMHTLIPHGRDVLQSCPREYHAIRAWMENIDIEGVVWHHPDGRMCKLKKKDFGFLR